MKNKTIIITLIILLIISISIGMFAYLKANKEIKRLNTYIEVLEEEDDLEQQKYKEEKQKEEEKRQEEEKASCGGKMNATFEGIYQGNMKEETTITLKDDGTYTKSIKESEYQEGTYEIVNGIISFEYSPSGAPSNVKTKYSYKISEDCNEITIRNDNFSYTAYKK